MSVSKLNSQHRLANQVKRLKSYVEVAQEFSEADLENALLHYKKKRDEYLEQLETRVAQNELNQAKDNLALVSNETDKIKKALTIIRANRKSNGVIVIKRGNTEKLINNQDQGPSLTETLNHSLPIIANCPKVGELCERLSEEHLREALDYLSKLRKFLTTQYEVHKVCNEQDFQKQIAFINRGISSTRKAVHQFVLKAQSAKKDDLNIRNKSRYFRYFHAAALELLRDDTALLQQLDEIALHQTEKYLFGDNEDQGDLDEK